MKANEYYKLGELDNAIATIIGEVKKHPTDIKRRGFLCELLFIKRAWERVDKQLDLIGHQDPNSMHMVSLWRQLIRAGQARDQYFLTGRIPEVVEEPNELTQVYLKASVCLREKNQSEAFSILDASENQRAPLKGQINGKEFSDFRDLDDSAPGILEVMTSTGKYYWIPFSRIVHLTFHDPEGPLDLVLRRATLEVNQGGPDGEVYVPAIYHTTTDEHCEKMLLGNITQWKGNEGEPIIGLGQKMFLADDNSLSIMEIKELSFNP